MLIKDEKEKKKLNHGEKTGIYQKKVTTSFPSLQCKSQLNYGI